MKTIQRLALFLTMGMFVSCGGNNENTTDNSQNNEPVAVEETEVLEPASTRITLDNKGVGQIKSIELGETIDAAMAERGSELFNTNCSACHKTDKRFIGPNPTGILERRSPEWVMNMILDPKLMVEEDQCAKDLLVEFNGAAMANQNMSEEQAREILEFFRTLK